MVRTQIRDKVDSNIVSINSHEVLRHIPETEHLSNIVEITYGSHISQSGNVGFRI